MATRAKVTAWTTELTRRGKTPRALPRPPRPHGVSTVRPVTGDIMPTEDKTKTTPTREVGAPRLLLALQLLILVVQPCRQGGGAPVGATSPTSLLLARYIRA